MEYRGIHFFFLKKNNYSTVLLSRALPETPEARGGSGSSSPPVRPRSAALPQSTRPSPLLPLIVRASRDGCRRHQGQPEGHRLHPRRADQGRAQGACSSSSPPHHPPLSPAELLLLLPPRMRLLPPPHTYTHTLRCVQMRGAEVVAESHRTAGFKRCWTASRSRASPYTSRWPTARPPGPSSARCRCPAPRAASACLTSARSRFAVVDSA